MHVDDTMNSTNAEAGRPIYIIQLVKHRNKCTLIASVLLLFYLYNYHTALIYENTGFHNSLDKLLKNENHNKTQSSNTTKSLSNDNSTNVTNSNIDNNSINKIALEKKTTDQSKLRQLNEVKNLTSSINKSNSTNSTIDELLPVNPVVPINGTVSQVLDKPNTKTSVTTKAVSSKEIAHSVNENNTLLQPKKYMSILSNQHPLQPSLNKDLAEHFKNNINKFEDNNTTHENSTISNNTKQINDNNIVEKLTNTTTPASKTVTQKLMNNDTNISKETTHYSNNLVNSTSTTMLPTTVSQHTVKEDITKLNTNSATSSTIIKNNTTLSLDKKDEKIKFESYSYDKQENLLNNYSYGRLLASVKYHINNREIKLLLFCDRMEKGTVKECNDRNENFNFTFNSSLLRNNNYITKLVTILEQVHYYARVANVILIIIFMAVLLLKIDFGINNFILKETIPVFTLLIVTLLCEFIYLYCTTKVFHGTFQHFKTMLEVDKSVSITSSIFSFSSYKLNIIIELSVLIFAMLAIVENKYTNNYTVFGRGGIAQEDAAVNV